MSYASEVARGIQKMNDKAFDALIMSPRANASQLETYADRSMRARLMADGLEYADFIRDHGRVVDQENAAVRKACDPHRIENVKVKGKKL